MPKRIPVVEPWIVTKINEHMVRTGCTKTDIFREAGVNSASYSYARRTGNISPRVATGLAKVLGLDPELVSASLGRLPARWTEVAKYWPEELNRLAKELWHEKYYGSVIATSDALVSLGLKKKPGPRMAQYWRRARSRIDGARVQGKKPQSQS